MKLPTPTTPRESIQRESLKQLGSHRPSRRVLVVWAAGTIVAIGIIALGASPTGAWWSDAGLLIPLVTFVLWYGRHAPWWAIAGSAVVPLVLGWGIYGIALSTIAALIAFVNRSLGDDEDPLRYAALGLLLWALSAIGPVGPLGVPTAISSGLVLAIVSLSLRAGHRDEFRSATRIVGGAAIAAFVAVALTGVLAWWAQGDLREGRQLAEQGLESAAAGDLGEAQQSLGSAGDRFQHAHWKLSNPITWMGRLVPVVGQNVGAASGLSGIAADFSDEIVDTINAAREIKLDNSTIDLDSVDNLVADAEDLPDKVSQLRSTVENANSPWLVGELESSVGTMNRLMSERSATLDGYAASAQFLPEFLGAEGARHYLIMFTTPAESRGPGGFMGNFAEITIDQGRIELTRFGRTNDLEEAMDPDLTLDDAPEDWLKRYGRWGLVGGKQNRVAPDIWAIVNLSPHFPSTAQVAAELYKGSEGNDLDGIFSLDVYGLEALVGLVGPIEVEGAPTLDGDNTADFLLLDQYLVTEDDSGNRIDMLSTIADETLTRLLVDDPPSPLSFGTALAPLARERRVLAWAADPDEQAVFDDIEISGALLNPQIRNVNGEVQPAFQMVLNNGAGNKIDTFLRRDVDVDGRAVTIRLTNTAPSSGLPEYVIGNAGRFDDPPGTNIANVTIYSTEEFSNFTVNGEEEDAGISSEAGSLAYDIRESIRSGETLTITFETVTPDIISIAQPLAYEVDDPVDTDNPVDGNPVGQDGKEASE